MTEGFSLWGAYVKFIWTLAFGALATIVPIILISAGGELGWGPAILAAIFSLIFGWGVLYLMYPSVFKKISIALKK